MTKRTVGWPYKKEFQCHRCGNCCRGDGFVELTETDIDQISSFLGIDREEFLDEYCDDSGADTHLLDQKDEEQSCIFLEVDEKGLAGCRIQKVKPEQCRGFPFQWRPKNALKYCDGLRALEGLPPVGKKTISG